MAKDKERGMEGGSGRGGEGGGRRGGRGGDDEEVVGSYCPSRNARLPGEFTDATGEALEAIYYEGEETLSAKPDGEKKKGKEWNGLN